MTIRGQEPTLGQIAFTLLGAVSLILLSIITYFMRDMMESMRSVREDMSAMKVRVEAQVAENSRTRSELDDIRGVIYNHLTRGND